MKIRKGFVSNSSSSSFCIMGFYAGESNMDNEDIEQKLPDGLEIEYGCNSYDDSVYFGLPVSEMKEDETLAQFRKRVEDKLVGTEFEGTKIEWITDGGYSG